jgi:hypothetical protein
LSIGDELSLDGVLVKPVDMTKFERLLVDIAREDGARDGPANRKATT